MGGSYNGRAVSAHRDEPPWKCGKYMLILLHSSRRFAEMYRKQSATGTNTQGAAIAEAEAVSDEDGELDE
jgi:hypothetical protein